MTSLAIFGATGRMGQCLVKALGEPWDGAPGAARSAAAPSWTLSGAIASAGSRRLGQEAAADGIPTGISITADPCMGLRGAQVAVDFSLPHCAAANVQACVAAGVPLLVGSTGLETAALAVLRAAARHIAVLVAPNTSIGASVLARLVAAAAAALGPAYDVEIYEAHHRLKRDAPSGTALALGEVVAGIRGSPLAQLAVFDRHGEAAVRAPGSIGFAVVRAGDIIGEHTVLFSAAGERVEITHRATDRMTFARGALRAAHWLHARPPGFYTMESMLRG